MRLWEASVEEVCAAMRAEGLRRTWLVDEAGEVRASHPSWQAAAISLAMAADYDRHRALFFELGEESGHLLSAAIHKTKRGQAAGGVRLWSYASFGAMIEDGLRLSRGMGHKNALAGLWWGGGKGVIARQAGLDYRDPELRRRIYRDYGRFISGLRGCYVTAEDAGTTPADMAHVFATTRHTTCIPPAVGGSGNPSVLTAHGVVVAIEAALEATGSGSLQDKTVVSEGAGNVARHMFGELLRRGVRRIVACDIDNHALAQVHRDERLELRHVEPGDRSIFATRGHVLSPNAVGASLNPDTIPMIAAGIVCGAANNQLADPARDAEALAARNILYVPDFLANRMGIVNCANEAFGVFPRDPAIQRHLERDTAFGIHQRTLEVIRRAEASGRTPADEAEDLADELANEPHPIWGDRASAIIDSLVRDDWAAG